MNSKKAKRLRRLAEGLTAGKPDRRLLASSRLVMDNHGRTHQCVVAINDQDTTRGIYRMIKGTR